MLRATILSLAVLVACAKAGGKDQPNPNVDAPDTTPIDAPDEEDIDASTIDAPNGCATQPCDILSKCGCAAGTGCDIDGTDDMGTACRTIFQPVAEGAQCANPTRCDAGFVCLFGSSGPSVCKKYCGSDADCGQPRGQCVIDITSNGTPLAGIPSVCSSNCDPTNTAAGGCAAAMKCGMFTADDNGVAKNIVDCSLAGTGVQGAACTTAGQNDDTKCAANFLCTTAGTTACRKICNRTNNTGCVGAQTCIGFSTPFTTGGIEYGVCN